MALPSTDKYKVEKKTRQILPSTDNFKTTQKKAAEGAENLTKYYSVVSAFNDDSATKYVSDAFKKKWNYDALDADDMARKERGSMPKSVKESYTDSKVDQYLKSRGLPAYKNLESYVEDYNTHVDTSNAMSKAKADIYESWQKVIKDSGDKNALTSDNAANLFWDVAGTNTQYNDYFKTKENEVDPDNYDTTSEAREAEYKQANKTTSPYTIYFEDMYNEFVEYMNRDEIEQQKKEAAAAARTQTGVDIVNGVYNDTSSVEARLGKLNDSFARANGDTSSMTTAKKAETALKAKGYSDTEIGSIFNAAGKYDEYSATKNGIEEKAKAIINEADRVERESSEDSWFQTVISNPAPSNSVQFVKTQMQGTSNEYSPFAGNWEKNTSVAAQKTVDELIGKGCSATEVLQAFSQAGYADDLQYALIDGQNAFEVASEEVANMMVENGSTKLDAYNTLTRNGYRVDESKHSLASYEQVLRDGGLNEDEIAYSLNALTEAEKLEIEENYAFDTNIEQSLGTQLVSTLAAIPIRAALNIAAGAVNFADMTTGWTHEGQWDAAEWLNDQSAKWASFGNDANTTGLKLVSDIGSEILRMYATSAIGGAIAGGSSALSIGTSKVLSVAPTVLRSAPFVAGAMGNYYAEAMQAGASKQDATTYGITAGLMEGLLEAFGTSEMFGKIYSKAVCQKLVKGGKTFLASEMGIKSAGLVLSTLGEAVEEGASYLYSGLAQMGTWNPEWELDGNELWQNMYMGGLIGFVGSAAMSQDIAGNIYTELLTEYNNTGKISTQTMDNLQATVMTESMPDAKKNTVVGQKMELADYSNAVSEVTRSEMSMANAETAYNERVADLNQKKDAAYQNYAQKKRLLQNAIESGDSKRVVTAQSELQAAKRAFNKTKKSVESQLQQAKNEYDSRVKNATESRDVAQAKLDSHYIAMDAQARAEFAQKALDTKVDELSQVEARITELATQLDEHPELETEYDALVEQAHELQQTISDAANTSDWMNMESESQRAAWAGAEQQRTASVQTATETAARIDEVVQTVSTHQDWAQVEKIANRLGVKVVAVEDLGSEFGRYENGTIYISNKSTDPAMAVFKHELTHYIEGSKNYESFRRYVWDRLGANANKLVTAMQRAYAEKGISLNRQEAMREVTAQWTQENLFTNDEAIDTLVKMQTKTAKGIYNWLASTIQKFGQNKQTRSLITAEQKFRKAFSDANVEVQVEPVETASVPYQASFGMNLDELIQRYGEMPQGEMPVREIHLPSQINDETRSSKFMRTVMESANVDENFVNAATENFANGLGSYTPISNAKAISYAKKKIGEQSLTGAMREWNAILDSGKRIGKYEIAFGEQLLSEFTSMGDTQTAMKLTADLCAQATRSGQSTQAFSLLKRMTPEGALYYVQRSVQNLNRQYEKQIQNGKMQPFELTEDMAKMFLEAKSYNDILVAESEIVKQLSQNVPSTLADKITAWRYLAMLGNPRTNIRNILGNTAMYGISNAKDVVATGLEHLLVEDSERTKAIVNRWSNKDLYDYAKSTWDEAKPMFEGGKEGIADQVYQNRRIFKTKALEKARELSNNLLEAEDTLFIKVKYEDSFAQAMKARGLTPDTITPEQSSEIMNIAALEAMKTTFHDASALATALNNLENTNAATKLAVGSVLPFKKTPINVLKRGIEYSPIGLIKGLSYDLMQVRNGNMTAAQAIDEISSGIVGSGLFALGMFLSKSGVLRGAGGDDDDYEYFMSDMGEQDYSINIGDMSFTLDWLSPAAMPLFAGVELMDAIEGTSEVDLGTVFDAIAKVADPLTEMSMLQGVSDMLTQLSYTEGSAAKLGVLAGSAAKSYVSQFVPTLLGQISRTIDTTRRDTYGSNSLEKAANTLINKTPARSALEPYVDKWGREQTDPWFTALLENTILPGYVSEKDVSPINTELSRLYLETGNRDVIPVKPNRTLQNKKGSYTLKGEEYTQYQKEMGESCYAAVDAVISSSSYAMITDDEKRAEKVQNALEKAEKKVKKEYQNKYITGGE